jgi:hypothetical protein
MSNNRLQTSNAGHYSTYLYRYYLTLSCLYPKLTLIAKSSESKAIPTIVTSHSAIRDTLKMLHLQKSQSLNGEQKEYLKYYIWIAQGTH